VIRVDSFGRSAAFAAVGALVWMPWAMLVAPFLGVPAARALYLVTVAALYCGALAKSSPRRVSTTVLVAIVGSLLALVARGTPELCLGLAAALGVVRSGLAHRTAGSRAVVIEAILLVGGLLFARFLATGALATALGVWGFLLVQSCWFLVGGTAARANEGHHPDPFEEAYARAAEVFERPVG
jgi:hypothetical protein